MIETPGAKIRENLFKSNRPRHGVNNEKEEGDKGKRKEGNGIRTVVDLSHVEELLR